MNELQPALSTHQHPCPQRSYHEGHDTYTGAPPVFAPGQYRGPPYQAHESSESLPGKRAINRNDSLKKIPCVLPY